MGKRVIAEVSIRGTRPLLQHQFGPDALPLEKVEKGGVPGNDPTEWKRTCMVDGSGRLYLPGPYAFATITNGARYTKKGRGSIQTLVAATLVVMDERILITNRSMPKDGSDPTNDPTQDVYVYIAGVKNPATKGRNVRYRLAASPGWECKFQITWDKTIVSREQMRAVLEDSGVLIGISNGRSIGFGRFEVVAFKEVSGAEEKAAA